MPRLINGAHAIIGSTNPEADRAFFRDVLDLQSADAGVTFGGTKRYWANSDRDF